MKSSPSRDNGILVRFFQLEELLTFEQSRATALRRNDNGFRYLKLPEERDGEASSTSALSSRDWPIQFSLCSRSSVFSLFLSTYEMMGNHEHTLPALGCSGHCIPTPTAYLTGHSTINYVLDRAGHFRYHPKRNSDKFPIRLFCTTPIQCIPRQEDL